MGSILSREFAWIRSRSSERSRECPKFGFWIVYDGTHKTLSTRKTRKTPSATLHFAALRAGGTSPAHWTRSEFPTWSARIHFFLIIEEPERIVAAAKRQSGGRPRHQRMAATRAGAQRFGSLITGFTVFNESLLFHFLFSFSISCPNKMLLPLIISPSNHLSR